MYVYNFVVGPQRFLRGVVVGKLSLYRKLTLGRFELSLWIFKATPDANGICGEALVAKGGIVGEDCFRLCVVALDVVPSVLLTKWWIL